MKDIVHLYFKRQFKDHLLLVRVNPVDYTGTELAVMNDGSIQKRELQFDENIEEDLAVDEFKAGSALEFNLYLKGLHGDRQ